MTEEKELKTIKRERTMFKEQRKILEEQLN